MLRLCVLLAIAGGLAGCGGRTYTIEGSSLAKANQRAERYCAERQDRPRFEGIERQDGARIEIYRCLPPRIVSS